MCRFLAYLGEPILAEDLITKPENSLIHQSFGAREMDEPLNGDGFGLDRKRKIYERSQAFLNR